MGKATGTKDTTKTPDTKAPAKTDTKPEKVKAAVKDVVTVKSGALSTDVGPMVLAGLSKTYADEQKANELLDAVNSKRYDLLSMTTQAIVKAVKADDSIDLSAAFSGDPKKMNRLNDQLGLVMGFREVSVLPATDKVEEIKRIGYAKAVAKYFPGPKDAKDTEEYQRKSTLRSNFLHMVKKCAQAASAIVEKDITFTTDKVSGTLSLSGPAVEARFGQKTVLLNEKQTIGTGETAIKLKEKPSFTAIAKMGAEAAGKVLVTRPQSSVASNAVDADTALQSICKSLADACSKLKLPANEATKRSLSIAQSAIDKVLQFKEAST